MEREREQLLRILLKRDIILRESIAEQREDLVLSIEVKQIAKQRGDQAGERMFADVIRQEFEELCLLQKAYRENRDRIVIANKIDWESDDE